LGEASDEWRLYRLNLAELAGTAVGMHDVMRAEFAYAGVADDEGGTQE